MKKINTLFLSLICLYCMGISAFAQPQCTASFTYQVDPSGSGVQFTNTSANSNINISSTWDFGDNHNSTAFNPLHQYANPGTYIVCLSIDVTTPNGVICTARFCDTLAIGQTSSCIDQLLIDPNVGCNFIYSPVCGCDGVTYTNDCEALNYHGVTHWTQGPCGGTGGGCQASFISQPSQPGLDVYFTNTTFNSPGWARSSTWDFGDGTSSTDENPYHTYASAGIYYVCLITTYQVSQMGPVCTSTFCDSVVVVNNWPGCQANFAFAVSPAALGVQFTDQSLVQTATYGIIWDFGDGTSSTDFNPFHLYQATGTYRVCMKLFAPVSGLGCQDSICKTVTVGSSNVCIDSSLINPNCICPAIYSPVCGCNGVTYGNSCEAQCSGVTHWTQGTCNSTNCQASFSYQLTPNSLTVQFTNTSTGSNTLNFGSSWDFGDNTISNANSPQHTYQAPGTYTVCVTITTSNSAGSVCTDTYCATVVVGLPHPCIDSSLIISPCFCPTLYAPVCGCDGVTYSNDCEAQCNGVTRWTQGTCGSQGCHASFNFTHTASGLTVQFNNNSTGNTLGTPFTSSWDFGDGTTSADQSPIHTFTSAGAYYICLTISVTTPNGVICTDTYCDSVRVGQNQPCVELSVIDTSIVCIPMGIPGVYCGCDGNTYASSCEAYNYHGVTSGTWSLNGMCGSQGCQAGFIFQQTPNSLTVHFNNTSNPMPGSAYISNWDFGDGSSSSDINPVHTFQAAGTYYVCLTITVANTNGTTCTSTYCDSVRVGINTPCIDPSLIDPNLACIQIYDPVCGCDGVTYSNKCEAVYHHGVTTWTPGPCGTGTCRAGFVWNYGFVPPTIFFTDISTGTNITNWLWDFGDGSTSSQQNPAHNYPHPGTYVVCLTITCATSPTGPVYTETWCDTIFHAAGCVDPSVIDPNYQCPTTYQPVCGCDSITYTNSCIAQYRHGVTFWTNGPCQNSALCNANFSFHIGTGTSPNTVSFNNLSTGPASVWNWTFGDNTTSVDRNPTHTYNHPGMYKVCLTISGNTTTCHDTFCDSIYIAGCVDPSLIIPNAQCPASYQPVCGCDSVTYYNACIAEKRHGVTRWTPGPCQNSCQSNFTFAYPITGNQIHFFNHSSGNYTRLKWDFGDGTFANNVNDPVHLYDVTGWYRVCLTISNPNGSCQSVYCDSVFANGCFDPTLIDPNQPCPAIFQPVCGCDGNTYQNACIAKYDHGITTFTNGACPSFGYCPTAGQDNHRVWITRVGSNLSGDDGGYAHFDLCHRTQLAGKTYILKLDGSTGALTTANFQAHWRVWWDFNHDFDFDDPGELVWQGFGALSQFAVYTIPVDACSGCTKMRVTLSDNFQNVCGNYPVGETEDYDITIRSNMACPLIPLAQMAHNDNLKTNEPNELDEEFAMEYNPLSFDMYPNPAQDKVNIHLLLAEDAQKVTVKLLDISGKEMYSYVVIDAGNNVSMQIETSQFANGIYQVAIQNDKGYRQVQKLVITR